MNTPCIEWSQCRDGKGYGLKWRDGQMRRAHRLAYCDAHGLELGSIKGKVVRHACDNPPCINPDHLELGTQGDNCRDRDERGRAAVGEKSGRAKLTAEQVAQARKEYVKWSSTHGTTALARKYGVSNSVMYKAIAGDTWAKEAHHG